MLRSHTGKEPDITNEKNIAPAANSSFPLIIIIFANMTVLGFVSSMKGVSFPLVKSGFNASYNEMGGMNALIYLASVCSCTAAGLYMNRFGLKKTAITSLFIVMSGVSTLYFASSFWMVVAFFVILQAGIGFSEIGLNGMGVRIFTKKSALMQNLLHFFFGAGSIAGPRFMGYMVNHREMSWQGVYPLAVIPLFMLLAASLAVRYPGKIEAANTGAKPSFQALLKEPMVWFFGIALGLSGAIEGCSVAWSGLYLLDVHGLDPSTVGATFVSVFYILYTLSRFLSGFIIEKIGYMRSIILSSGIIFVLLAVSFILGRKGIYLLPVVGFFVAIIWPTIMAIGIGLFRERVQAASSIMIVISFTLNGIIQFGFGLSNRFLGAAWAYRSCLLYSLILVVLLSFLGRRNKAR